MYNKKDLNKKLEKIGLCASLEETECGEYWYGLLELENIIDSDGMSEEFRAACLKEIDRVYNELCTDWKIIEEKAIVETRKGDKVISKREIVEKTLVHISEW